MNQKDNELLKRLLATFKVEAQEHIKTISSSLMELEPASTAEERMKLIETIFRESHSLKGAARAVNMSEVESICQQLENIFAALKAQEVALSQALFDLLHRAVDFLGSLLPSIESERTDLEKSQITELIQNLKNALTSVLAWPKREDSEKEEKALVAPKPEFQQPLAEAKPILTETVRISTTKLDSLLLQVEELIPAKLATSQQAAELQKLKAALALWKKEWTKFWNNRFRSADFGVRSVKEELKEELKNPQLIEFLEWNRDFMASLETELTDLTKSAERDNRALSRMVDDLLEDMKKVLMRPFSSILEVFPRFVRELSRGQGKAVELVMQGGDIEIDRRILEELKDPLIHLVRNCIDHGIEKPEARERKKKPLGGTITISISQKNGRQVEILVSDDGTGIDVGIVKEVAVSLGIISPEKVKKLDEQEALSLIFQSGVSTSPIITDISGRGLGLAIVQEKVEKLNGSISLETHPDVGTTFRMVLPTTLATFRGVVVSLEKQLFILPTTNVDQVVRVKKEAIKTVENRETIELNGQAVSLVRLKDALGLPSKIETDADDMVQLVVLASAEKRIAFLVDEIFNEQEVLVKSLGKQLSRLKNIAGSTVMGSGKVVPILNVSDLMKSAIRVRATGVKPIAETLEKKEEKLKSVLVVEDSITSRTLLENILQSSGYQVTTAVDGIDAFTKLRSGQFDIVISDVDMPRMNGFDLTAKLRSDKKLADLPVVLVTALGSREDKERGIEVGANAYIVKSSFDQSNLIEVVRRLI